MEGVVEAAVTAPVEAVPDVVAGADVDGRSSGIAGEVGLAGQPADVADLAEDQRRHYGADAADLADPRRVLVYDGADAGLDLAQFCVEAFDVLGVVEGELLARLSYLVARPDAGEDLTCLGRGEPTCGATRDQLGEQLVQPVDLDKTVGTFQLALVASVDVAYLAGEVAAIGRGFTAPARVIAMRAQGESELAIAQGDARNAGKTWATPGELADNHMLPLPEPVRRGLVNLAEEVISAANLAVASVASLDSGQQSHRQPNPRPNADRTAANVDVAFKPVPEGPRR